MGYMNDAAQAIIDRDAVIADLRQQVERLTAAVDAINNIRNSIIGLQTMNWSEHVYPLVAALEAAGMKGMGYPAARENFGTMLSRATTAEAQLAAEREAVRVLGQVVIAARNQRNYEAKNNIVPGGCVSATLEQCAVHVLNNPIAAAAVKENA